MSGYITSKTFEEIVEIHLDEVTEQDLMNLEETAHHILRQKLEKLNIIIGNMNVYAHNGHLLINDRYRVCSDLQDIALAFGFHVKKVECSLRGNNYILTDPLVTLLKEIGARVLFGDFVANQPVSEEIKYIIEKNATVYLTDELWLDIIKNIRKNGRYITTKKRTVEQTYEDDIILLDETKGAWDFDESRIRAQLKAFAKRSEDIINSANTDMLNGTTKLIYSRARQMGYAVEQVKKGKDVQLVLVRLQ